MNHYPHHIGDYLKDTAHLDPLEDGIYRRMIDLYYTQEGPLEANAAVLCRRLRLDQRKHGKTLDSLLSEFFHLNDMETHWHHTRCDIEIEAYQSKADANRKNGKLGGRPKITQEEPTNNPSGFKNKTQNNLNQNQEPVTNNQEPSKAERATRLPPEWTLPDEWLEWSTTDRGWTQAMAYSVASQFKDHWIAKPGKDARKLDWFATWRKWCRNERSAPSPQSFGKTSQAIALLENMKG